MIVLRSTFEAERERRSRAEANAQGLAHDVAHLIAERDRVLDENKRLMRELLALRREGFDPPTVGGGIPGPVEQDDEKKLPPEVLNALSDVANPGTELYQDEAARAQKKLEAGIDAKAVAQAILRGGTFKW